MRIGGRTLPDERVRELFHAPWPLPWGRESHDLTAAATAQIVEALLSDDSVRTHAPAPAGRPGGYPLLIGAGRVALDLPASLGEEEAVAINARAARWDGLERVEPDGTLVLTDAVAETTERQLGVRVVRPPASIVDPAFIPRASPFTHARPRTSTDVWAGHT